MTGEYTYFTTQECNCPTLLPSSPPAYIWPHGLNRRWASHWFRECHEAARMSRDPSTKVGAVAVTADNKRRLADGYNGFPPGMRDNADDYSDRESKLTKIVHAEENLIGWAARRGVALEGATLYVEPLHPCSRCAKLIASAGITRIVIIDRPVPDRWAADFAAASAILAACGVAVCRIPSEVLDL